MAYLLKYGSYVLPKGMFPAGDDFPRALPSAKLPRVDGARIPTGYYDKRKLTVRGMMIKGPSGSGWGDNSDLRTRIDALKAALATGPASLYFDDDRYWRNAQAGNASVGYGEGTHYTRIATIQVDFEAGDPFTYLLAGQTVTWTVSASAQTKVVTAAGNAYALPVLSITVGGAGAQTINFTVTNNTTGQAFTLQGAVTGGDVIVVDCLNQTCTIGAVDKMLLFDGIWPQLNVGANTFAEVYTGGSITQVVFAWNDRYW